MISEIPERIILVSHHMQSEGRDLQMEIRCFPISQKLDINIYINKHIYTVLLFFPLIIIAV